MERLRTLISDPAVRGVAESASGERVEFRRSGVVDLYELVTSRPCFLQGGRLADRIIGRGAAFLAVKGGVSELFAYVISRPALEVLQRAGIKTEYGRLEDNIANRDGTDICPVEKATLKAQTAEEALPLIKDFLASKHII